MSKQIEHFEIPIGSERGFAFVFTVVFTLVGLHPMLDGGPFRVWALAVAGPILFLGIVAPRVYAVPNRIWWHLGNAIGSVVSQVVMAALFLLVLTPTGLVMRLFRRLPAEHAGTPDPGSPTYWITRGPNTNPMESLRHQY